MVATSDTFRVAQAHALYRFFDDAERLLYVGITLGPGSRWKQHSKGKPWWADVASITVEQHPNRESALTAERAAIIAERPLYNVIHNGRSETPASQAHADAMPDDCHDYCARDGIASIYHPYRWSGGIAHYACNRGHRWTCSWGASWASGEDMSNYGTPIEQFRETLTPRERLLVEATGAGHWGPVL